MAWWNDLWEFFTGKDEEEEKKPAEDEDDEEFDDYDDFPDYDYEEQSLEEDEYE